MSVKFLKKTKKKLTLKRMLQARLGGFNPARSKKVIHASDLTRTDREYCPREIRLLDVIKKKSKSEYLDTALHITFEEGRDKQARFNNDWLRDVMWGSWKCTGCNEVIDFGPDPEGCNDPVRTCDWRYVEPRVVHVISKTSGGIDAVVAFGSKLIMVECKIMGSTQFKQLKAPLAEHRLRTQLYLELIKNSEDAWTKKVRKDKAIILYIMRGHGMKDDEGRISPFKEYEVKANPEGVRTYLGKAQAVTVSRSKGNDLFPCGVCATQMDKRAKKCLMAKDCFSGKYSWDITWSTGNGPKHLNASVMVSGFTKVLKKLGKKK